MSMTFLADYQKKMTSLSSFFFSPNHKPGLNQQNLSLVEINYFFTLHTPLKKIKSHFYLKKVSKCICVAYHELREPCNFKTMVSTKPAFLRTCNGTSVWGDITNWSSKIDLFRVLYRIKFTALRLWQSNGLRGNKSQELQSYICSSTEFCWDVPRPVAEETWLPQLRVPRPSHE